MSGFSDCQLPPPMEMFVFESALIICIVAANVVCVRVAIGEKSGRKTSEITTQWFYQTTNVKFY